MGALDNSVGDKWSVAKRMPLMGEFTCYIDCEIEAQEWTRMLYNRAVGLVKDYFIISLKGIEARAYFDASGSPKNKL